MKAVDDIKVLTELNLQFIDAWRKGSWDLLEPILSPSFRYLDGVTGEVTELPAYIEELRANPAPTIGIDQVTIHVDGDVAAVSARSFTRPGRYTRYLDSYERRGDSWVCYHACLWRVTESGA